MPLKNLLPKPALVFALVLPIVFMSACKGGKTEEETKLNMKLNNEMVKNVEDVIITLPSPLELSSLLKKSKANFNKTVLNNPKDYDKYTDAFHQSVAMGAYGANLGYVSYYNQTDEATAYLTSINKLGTSLNILGAFEADLLTRVEGNISNQDSLLYIITEQFDAAESYLKSVQRADAATGILAGGWIEGLYIATQINKTTPNDLIKERVGETKLSLNSLLQLLESFKTDPNFGALDIQLRDLRIIYEDVKITYGPTPDAPAATSKPKTADGKPDLNQAVTVTSGSTSTVQMSDETLKKITDKIAEIRTSLMKTK